MADVYSVFSEWYRINHPSYAKDKIGRNTLKSELIKVMGPIGKNSKWFGWQSADEEDDESDEDEFDPTVSNK